MRTITVKELMVPLEEYATVLREATLFEAVLALEKAQAALVQSQYKHRAILILDQSKKVLGKITMKDILIALEPNYGNLEGMEVLSRSGYSPELIKTMLENNALWLEPLQFICERATQLKVKDFMSPTKDDEHIDENATLDEAVHQLVMYPYISLLVTRADKVVGILRLSDVFIKICDKIKTCGL